MRSPLWYFIFFYSVQSNQESQFDTACVKFPNDRLQMNSHSVRHPFSEVDMQTQTRLSQTSMMKEPRDRWPLIPENCFITRPIRMALPQQLLGMFNLEETLRQIIGMVSSVAASNDREIIPILASSMASPSMSFAGWKRCQVRIFPAT
jgi:hypothetical protein